MKMQNEIIIAAAVLINSAGEMLLVRKKGTTRFMQPGGKIDNGETPIQALRRELREEIALELEPEDVTFRGIFREQAANEPGATVVAHIFSASFDIEITPRAEIEEVLWFPLADEAPQTELALLTRLHLLPLARRLAGIDEGKAA